VSHVFLSYARRDQEFADRLVTALEGRGVNVWVDRQDIPGSAAWEAAIGEAVSVSSAVLVVLSPASVTSEYVPKELSLAEKYDRPIVPILYESWEGAADAAAVKRVEFQLAGLQYVDFAHQPFEPGLTALLRCLPATPAGVGTDRPTPAVEPRAQGGGVCCSPAPGSSRLPCSRRFSCRAGVAAPRRGSMATGRLRSRTAGV
jgi:TIR domain